jgi:hypothetical protein
VVGKSTTGFEVEPVTTAGPIGPTMDESATDVETGTEVGFVVVNVDVMVPVAPAPEEDEPVDPDGVLPAPLVEPPPVAVDVAVESVSVPPAPELALALALGGELATGAMLVCNRTVSNRSFRI